MHIDGAISGQTVPSTRAGKSWPWPAVTASLAALLLTPPLLYGYMAKFTANSDPFIYAQVAKEILSGRRLYTETWQDKPPLAYVGYGLPQLVAPRSITAIASLAGLCIAITSGLYAHAFRGCAPAMLATVLFVSLFPMTHADYYWPSTEMFSNVLVAGSLVVGLKIYRARKYSFGQCLLAGALACLAFHVRQNTIFCLLIPILAVWLATSSPRALLLALGIMLLGGLLAWLPMLGLVAWAGDVSAYLWTVFVYPRSFAAGGNLTQLLQLWWHAFASPLVFIAALFAGLATYGRRQAMLVIVTLAAGVLATSCTMRGHYHYWENSFPYVALLIGLGVQRISEVAVPIAWRLTMALGLAVVPATILQVIVCEIVAPRYRVYSDLAASADRLAPAEGTLLVCGGDQIEAVQFASRLRPANTFEWMIQLRDPWVRALPKPLETIIEEYLASPPDAIVTLRDWVAVANAAPDSSELSGDLRLLSALIKRHSYHIADEHGPFVIALRSGR